MTARRAACAQDAKAEADVKSAPVVGERDMWMVVGFEVMPCSIARDAGAKEVKYVPCSPWGHADNPAPQVIQEGADIVYTYDVYWEAR